MSKVLLCHNIARPAPRLFTPSPSRVLNYLSTQAVPSDSHNDRLAAQRLRRPISPHLTIYKWTYISSASALHRITGLLLSGSLYGFGTLYLLSPALGLHLDSASIADSFGSLPFAVKTTLKFGLTMPFTYHAFNGVKHLVWDSGRLLGKQQSGKATWIVLICSTSASLGLALYRPGGEVDEAEKP